MRAGTSPWPGGDGRAFDLLCPLDGDGDRIAGGTSTATGCVATAGILTRAFLDAEVVKPVSSNSALEKSEWFARWYVPHWIALA